MIKEILTSNIFAFVLLLAPFCYANETCNDKEVCLAVESNFDEKNTLDSFETVDGNSTTIIKPANNTFVLFTIPVKGKKILSISKTIDGNNNREIFKLGEDTGKFGVQKIAYREGANHWNLIPVDDWELADDIDVDDWEKADLEVIFASIAADDPKGKFFVKSRCGYDWTESDLKTIFKYAARESRGKKSGSFWVQFFKTSAKKGDPDFDAYVNDNLSREKMSTPDCILEYMDGVDGMLNIFTLEPGELKNIANAGVLVVVTTVGSTALLSAAAVVYVIGHIAYLFVTTGLLSAYIGHTLNSVGQIAQDIIDLTHIF